MTDSRQVQHWIGLVNDEAVSDDALDQLSAAAAMASELDTIKDELLSYFVDRCRGSGKSWTEISTALGVTKQAAHQRFSASTLLLNRLTPRTRHVVESAHDVARELEHAQVGPEHLLLAMYVEPESVGVRILEEGGLTRKAVEAAVLTVEPRGASSAESATWTPKAATALSGAATVALELGHNYVGTEHLLLSLMRDADTLSARILTANGFETGAIRSRVVEMLIAIQSQKSA